MKIRTHDRITEIDFDEKGYNIKSFDVEALLAKMRVYETQKEGQTGPAGPQGERGPSGPAGPQGMTVATGLSLAASAEVEYRDVTGEDILLATRLAGGRAVYEVDASGVITSISASIQTHFEFDTDDVTEVLESLQAAGPAASKLIGDLAQTSVGLSGAETQVLGLNEWTLDWKRKTADATTTDDDTYESSLGSTASWSAKAKYMFIDGDASQATYIYATITSPQSPQNWNFFPIVAVGRTCFSGLAYVDGLTIASGMGKVVATDVSLKGTGQLKVGVQIAPQANPNTGTGQTAEN